MLKDRIPSTLYEWLIVIVIVIILARLFWVIFLAPDQTAE